MGMVAYEKGVGVWKRECALSGEIADVEGEGEADL